MPFSLQWIDARRNCYEALVFQATNTGAHECQLYKWMFIQRPASRRNLIL